MQIRARIYSGCGDYMWNANDGHELGEWKRIIILESNESSDTE